MIDKTATWTLAARERIPNKITVRATPAPKLREGSGHYRVRRRKHKGGMLAVKIRQWLQRLWRKR